MGTAILDHLSTQADNRTNTRPLVSVIIPAYNEAMSIDATYKRLRSVLSNLDVEYELIFVNDGSKDGTLACLSKIAEQDPVVKVLDFSRNFGHQIAVTAGVDHANGDVVVLIDADLQDPPELITEFLAKWREGYDVVYAVRQQRNGETLFKRWSARFFYRFLKRMTDIDIPLDTGDFRLMTRRVAQTLVQSREHHRFIRGMVSWAGFRQIGIPYVRSERFAGESKYPFRKMLQISIDGITSFSFKPLQFATTFGVSVAALGFLGIVVSLFLKLFTRYTEPGWTSLMIVVLFLGGIQLLMLGILGEYVGRIYDEVRQRPLYVIRDTYNIDEKEGWAD